jgi:hypothetical protein
MRIFLEFLLTQAVLNPNIKDSLLVYDTVFFFFLYIFLLGYIHYGGAFIVTFSIRLILYITYIAPIVSPSTPSPFHLKQLQEVS